MNDHHYLENELQDTAASPKKSKEHPYHFFKNMDSDEHKHSWWMLIITKCQCQCATFILIMKICQRNHIEPFQYSDVQLRRYTGELVPLLGITSVNMECGEKQDVLQILVVVGEGPNILSRDSITAFKAFRVDFGQIDNLVASNQLQVLLEKHSSVFNIEIGTLKGIKVKLHVDTNVKPKFFKARSVFYALEL